MNFMFEWQEQYWFLPREHIFKLTCDVLVLYKHPDDEVFDDFLRISDHFPNDFRKFSKTCPKVTRMLRNISRKFPKMPEDFQRLSKTYEEDPKMFRSYTNEFKNNSRDKLDISEITDNFISKVMENTPLESRM